MHRHFVRLSFCSNLKKTFFLIQRLPNGPSSILDDADIDRQREGEIERQRSELGQLKERLALMCRQVHHQRHVAVDPPARWRSTEQRRR